MPAGHFPGDLTVTDCRLHTVDLSSLLMLCAAMGPAQSNAVLEDFKCAFVNWLLFLTCHPPGGKWAWVATGPIVRDMKNRWKPDPQLETAAPAGLHTHEHEINDGGCNPPKFEIQGLFINLHIATELDS